MRTFLPTAAGLLLPLCLGACGGPSTTTPSTTLVSIEVDGKAPAVGGSSQFTATATFSNGITQNVTNEATWQSTNQSAARVSPSGMVTVLTAGQTEIDASFHGVTGTRQISVANPQVELQVECDPTLWSHVYTPGRLKVVEPCLTVLGRIASHHTNDDGDIDVRLAVDPPYASLLNAANISKLNGLLQTEVICAVPPRTAVAAEACDGFHDSIRIPPDGTHVQVTGKYVLDTNHGWMEIHPISVLRVTQ